MFDQTFTGAAVSQPFKIGGGETVIVAGTFEAEVSLAVTRQFVGPGEVAGVVAVDSPGGLAVFNSEVPVAGRWTGPATAVLPGLRSSPSVLAHTELVVTVSNYRSGAVQVTVA